MKRIGIYIIALLTVGCTRDRSPEAVTLSGVPVVIASAVADKAAGKAVVENATELAGVQFLRKDGAEQPTDFSDAVALTGDRAASGNITFTPSVPMYQLSSNKAYFRAYHPAGTVANGVVRWGVSGDKDILVGSVFDAGSYTAPLTGAGGDQGSPMIFTHRLAQLEVACVADPSDATPEALVQFVWGQVKSIELVETMTELAFDYATGAVEGKQPGAVALLKEDYATAFQAADLTKVGFKAAAMLVPAGSGTAPIKLKITTDKATEVIEVQLKNNTTPMGFEVGRKHTVSLQFKAADKQILVAGTKVSDWGAGYASSVTVEGEEWTIGSLAASVANPIAASGAEVSVTSPGAKLGLAWTAGLSVTEGFTLGAVTGTGSTAAAAVTVALNPTNAVRSTVLTATGPYYLSSTLTLSQAASTMGTLSQTPVNNISASGAEVTVTTPGATAGLPWGAGLSNTTGFTLGTVTGSGATGSVPVTVGVNPTNATRSSVLTATATGGNTAGTITLTQAASAFAASAPAEVGKAGATVDLTITGTPGLGYKVTKKSGDENINLSAEPTTGTIPAGGSATAAVVVAKSTTAARSAIFTVSCTTAGTTFTASDQTVSQEKGVDPRKVGYITEAGDGTGLPAGMFCVGMFGGHDGTTYTKALYIDKRGTATSGVNQGNVDDVKYAWNYTETAATNAFTGLANTNMQLAYTSAAYCRNKGADWYVPAIRQLKDGIYAAHVAGILTSEYTFVGKTYGSSTEPAGTQTAVFCTDFVDGKEWSMLKYNNGGYHNLFYVRCVREY